MSNQAYELGFESVGLDVQIWPSARIAFPEAISIGDSVIIDDFAFLVGGTRWRSIAATFAPRSAEAGHVTIRESFFCDS